MGTVAQLGNSGGNMYLIGSEITVNWTLEPAEEPIPLSSLDIYVTEPNGLVQYTNAAIAAERYVAPTDTSFGMLSYLFYPDALGLWLVTLTDGTELENTIYYEYKLQIDTNDIYTRKFVPGALFSVLGFQRLRTGLFGIEGQVANLTVTVPAETGIKTITEGFYTDGFGQFEYGIKTAALVNGPFGSVNPTTYYGNEILGLYYTDSFNDSFIFVLDGLHAQGLFTDLTPQDGVTLTSAGAFSYTQENGHTAWQWINQTIPAIWDGTGAVTVILT